MREQCKCELPYVNAGTDTCIYCRNWNTSFFVNRSISPKREFDGSEYNPGDIVEIITKSYSCYVEIVKYVPNGWYQVKLPNGGFTETQYLGKIVKPCKP